MGENDKKATKKPAKASKGFTDEERAAMRARVQEQKAAAARRTGSATCSRRSPRCRRLIAPWPSGCTRSSRPARQPSRPRPGTGCPPMLRTAKIVCFFQSADKFKTRYATLGFSDKANLDDGGLWPTAFALKEPRPPIEARIVALVKKAAS